MLKINVNEKSSKDVPTIPTTIRITSKNGHESNTMEYLNALYFNDISKVTITNKSKKSFVGNQTYNLEEIATIEGTFLRSYLKLSSDVSKESVSLISRVGQPKKLNDNANFSKIVSTGGDYFFGISNATDRKSTNIEIGLYKLDDYSLVGEKTTLDSVCEHNDGIITTNYAILALGCHKGADY